jgi:hypothetical protein
MRAVSCLIAATMEMIIVDAAKNMPTEYMAHASCNITTGELRKTPLYAAAHAMVTRQACHHLRRIAESKTNGR